MLDLGAFLTSCLMSGTLFTSACALVVVPPLAWIAVRALVPIVRRMNDDVSWQAPLAAISAALPGALFAFLSVLALAGGTHSPCLKTTTGRILYTLVASVAVAGIARAGIFAIRRHNEVRSLVRASLPASARLAAIAQACGVHAREVPSDRALCALAGIRNPVVLVSSETLRRLDDEELAAALLHERAHACRGDQTLAATLAFCADLLPLPENDLIAMYRAARELAADRQAAQEAAPETLASALLALAHRAYPSPLAASAFIHGCGLAERLRALLTPPPTVAVDPRRRITVSISLVGIVVASLAPSAETAFRLATCPFS
jgi:Zn-dependent protease with chaperone function